MYLTVFEGDGAIWGLKENGELECMDPKGLVVEEDGIASRVDVGPILERSRSSYRIRCACSWPLEACSWDRRVLLLVVEVEGGKLWVCAATRTVGRGGYRFRASRAAWSGCELDVVGVEVNRWGSLICLSGERRATIVPLVQDGSGEVCGVGRGPCGDLEWRGGGWGGPRFSSVVERTVYCLGLRGGSVGVMEWRVGEERVEFVREIRCGFVDVEEEEDARKRSFEREESGRKMLGVVRVVACSGMGEMVGVLGKRVECVVDDGGRNLVLGGELKLPLEHVVFTAEGEVAPLQGWAGVLGVQESYRLRVSFGREQSVVLAFATSAEREMWVTHWRSGFSTEKEAKRRPASIVTTNITAIGTGVWTTASIGREDEVLYIADEGGRFGVLDIRRRQWKLSSDHVSDVIAISTIGDEAVLLSSNYTLQRISPAAKFVHLPIHVPSTLSGSPSPQNTLSGDTSSPKITLRGSSSPAPQKIYLLPCTNRSAATATGRVAACAPLVDTSGRWFQESQSSTNPTALLLYSPHGPLAAVELPPSSPIARVQTLLAKPVPDIQSSIQELWAISDPNDLRRASAILLTHVLSMPHPSTTVLETITTIAQERAIPSLDALATSAKLQFARRLASIEPQKAASLLPKDDPRPALTLALQAEKRHDDVNAAILLLKSGIPPLPDLEKSLKILENPHKISSK